MITDLKNKLAKAGKAFIDYISKVNFAPGQVECLALLGGKPIELVITGVPTPEERRRYQLRRQERRAARQAVRAARKNLL
jgi:hypothetical protein